MGKKRLFKIVLIVLICIALLVCGGLLTLRILTVRTNFQSAKDVRGNDEAYETETEQLHAEDIYHLDEVTMLPEEQMDGMYTMLVIAGASPEDEEKGGDARSDADAVLLLNFNTPMKTLYLASFDTDLYTMIPDKGPGRLGNAYAVGGGPLLADTITQNYGVPINNYAIISLEDAARIMEMPELAEVDVSHEGVEVLRKLIFSLNITDPTQVVGKLTEMLSYVTHNIDSQQMMSLLFKAPGYVSFYSSDDMIPYEGLSKEVDGYVVPYIGETSRRLQETMFQRP